MKHNNLFLWLLGLTVCWLASCSEEDGRVKYPYSCPERDIKKDRILELYGIPLVRLSTIGSNEKKIIGDKLSEVYYKTQKEVADMLGISQSYISRLEKKIIKRLKRNS